MLIAISLLIWPWNGEEPVSSAVFNAGYVLGVFLLPMVNVLYLLLRVSGRKPQAFVPRWLMSANLFFLIVLLVFILFVY
ncbi:hypothetical protein GCM10027051_14220 [Niabella terrae]